MAAPLLSARIVRGASVLGGALVLAGAFHFSTRSSGSTEEAARAAQKEPLLDSIEAPVFDEHAFPDRGEFTKGSSSYRASPLPPDPNQIAQLVQSVSWQDWYGLYLADMKVGAARMTLRKTRNGEPGEFLIASDVLLRPMGDGENETVLTTDVRHYAGTPPFSLVLYESLNSATGREVRARFDSVATIDIKQDKDSPTKRRTSPASKENLRYAFSSWLAGPDLPRKILKAKEFDGNSLRDSSVEVIPVEVKEVALHKKREKVLITDIYRSIDNSTTRQRVNAEGRLLSETMSSGFSLRLEEKNQALRLPETASSPLK